MQNLTQANSKGARFHMVNYLHNPLLKFLQSGEKKNSPKKNTHTQTYLRIGGSGGLKGTEIRKGEKDASKPKREEKRREDGGEPGREEEQPICGRGDAWSPEFDGRG